MVRIVRYGVPGRSRKRKATLLHDGSCRTAVTVLAGMRVVACAGAHSRDAEPSLTILGDGATPERDPVHRRASCSLNARAEGGIWMERRGVERCPPPYFVDDLDPVLGRRTR